MTSIMEKTESLRSLPFFLINQSGVDTASRPQKVMQATQAEPTGLEDKKKERNTKAFCKKKRTKQQIVNIYFYAFDREI